MQSEERELSCLYASPSCGSQARVLCASQDRALAAHVLAVHKEGRAPRSADAEDALSADQLRAYIAEAKQHQPHLPAELTGEGC